MQPFSTPCFQRVKKGCIEKKSVNFAHYQNHCLTLCSAHLIPRIEEFQKFDSLLLNLNLLLKNSNVKQSIFKEVESAYGLQSLKLIKEAVTRCLCHRKAAERVPDCYQSLVAALDAINVRKHESAFRGLQDDLVDLFIYLYLQLAQNLKAYLQLAQNLKAILNTLIQSNRKSIL